MVDLEYTKVNGDTDPATLDVDTESSKNVELAKDHGEPSPPFAHGGKSKKHCAETKRQM